MNKVILYLKIQAKLLLILSVLCVLPLWAFYAISSIKFDNIYWVFLALLIIIRIIWQGESIYRKKIKDKVLLGLEKELKKRPNTNQIIKRSNEFVESRDLSFIFIAAVIFLTAVYFGKI